jgi:hypothetical protein
MEHWRRIVKSGPEMHRTAPDHAGHQLACGHKYEAPEKVIEELKNAATITLHERCTEWRRAAEAQWTPPTY